MKAEIKPTARTLMDHDHEHQNHLSGHPASIVHILNIPQTIVDIVAEQHATSATK